MRERNTTETKNLSWEANFCQGESFAPAYLEKKAITIPGDDRKERKKRFSSSTDPKKLYQLFSSTQTLHEERKKSFLLLIHQNSFFLRPFEEGEIKIDSFSTFFLYEWVILQRTFSVSLVDDRSLISFLGKFSGFLDSKQVLSSSLLQIVIPSKHRFGRSLGDSWTPLVLSSEWDDDETYLRLFPGQIVFPKASSTLMAISRGSISFISCFCETLTDRE